MFKILYAASNNQNAKVQLSRFLKCVSPAIQIKVAAYKLSSPKNVSIDWTLDCLLNIYKPDLISANNDNLNTYYEQIKSYNPDLIISDLEYFTSHIANVLDITLWQCSSSLINFALTKNEKYNLGLFKHHAYSLNRDPLHTQRTINLIDNSNCNFVYSHYGDTELSPTLLENFEWIRPYHQIAKEYIPCQHYLTAGLSSNNKKILEVLKQYPDTVAFMEFQHERHQNVLVKDIRIEDEYFCNLKNSNLFICEGQTSFLADAFYNGKYSLIYPDYEDAESIINSSLSEHLKLGKVISYTTNLTDYIDSSVYYCDNHIPYLHEKVNDLTKET